MLKKWVTVVSWKDQIALISYDFKTVCNDCAYSYGSHDQTSLSHIKTKTCIIALQSKQPLVSGQKIEIGISEKSFIKLATIVYLLPLFGLFIVGGFFKLLFSTDFASICGATLGGISSFLILQNLSTKVSMRRSFCPVVLNSRLPSD